MKNFERKSFSSVGTLTALAFILILALTFTACYGDSLAESDLKLVKERINEELEGDNSWEFNDVIITMIEGKLIAEGAESVADALNACPDFDGLTGEFSIDGYNLIYTLEGGKEMAVWENIIFDGKKPEIAAWDTNGNGVLEILAIGNSFSEDAMRYVYDIASDLGIENIYLGNLVVGGCSLAMHANYALADKATYYYHTNSNGVWSVESNYKMSTALESRDWDYIWLQQVSGQSGLSHTYNSSLDSLIEYVTEAQPSAKLAWHMTWAYQQDSTHADFSKYGSKQETMYNAIVYSVQEKILTRDKISIVIPSGTAVQNVRATEIGDTVTRDGYHLSFDYGRYIAGLMVVKSLTGLDISAVEFVPEGVGSAERTIAIDAVNAAYGTPYEVSK